MTAKPETRARMFWVKVDRSGGPQACWPWTGYRHPVQEYGVVWFEGRRQPAHRIAIQLTTGSPVPSHLVVDHLCRNRPCCNPAHLEPVSTRTNTLRGIGPAAVNAGRTSCVHGHPLDERNTRRWGGSRVCRTCHGARIYDSHAGADGLRPDMGVELASTAATRGG